MSSHVDDFNTRNKVLTAKLLRQGYKYHKIRMAFSKFYRRHFDIVSKFNVGLKNTSSARPSEPNFMATRCKNSEKYLVKMNFLINSKKIIVRYKKIGYNIDVLQQMICLVVNSVKVYSFPYLYNCTTVGRTSD